MQVTLRGAGWLTSSTLLLAVGRIALLGVMARLLAPEDFGVMAAAGIFTEFAQLLAQSGIIHPLVQRHEVTQDEIETAFTANIVSSLIATALVCAAAPYIAIMFHAPALRDVLYACSLLFPVTAMSAVSGKLLERAHTFRPIALSDLSGFFLGNVLVGLALAFAGFGVWALVGGTLASGVLRSVLLLRAQPHRLRLRIHLKVYRDLMRQGFGYSLQRFSNLVSLKGDYFVVGRMLGPAVLGQYERAYVLMNIATNLVMGPLNRVLFPAFARVRDDQERMGRAFLRCIALVSLLFLPASLMMIVLADEIIWIVLGPGWTSTVIPFQILAGGMFFRTGYKVADIAMNSLGKVYRTTFSQTVYAILVVGGAVISVRWGILGVAASTVVAMMAAYILQTQAVSGHIQLRRRRVIGAIAPAVFIAAWAGAATWGMAEILRSFEMNAFVIVLGSGTAAIIALAGILSLFPALLGRDSLSLVGPSAGQMGAGLDRRGVPILPGILARIERHARGS